MSTMCTDPSVYEVDAFWKSQGFSETDQVRHEILWQAAGRNEAPFHVGTCRFCAEMLESFQRMKGVVDSEGPVTLAVCPGAPTLSGYHYGEIRGEQGEAIADHLNVCTACREDLAFLARSQEPRDKILPFKYRLSWMAVAAAALLVSLASWQWTRRSQPRESAHVFQQSSRYASLADVPTIDRAQLMAVSPADHHSRIDQVIEYYRQGDYKKAASAAEIIVQAVDDPAAGYLLAMAQYKEGKLPQAFESMRQSERTQPLSAYRCWATLQMALMLGDLDTIKRELGHVEDSSEYRDRCVQLKEKLRLG